MNDRRLRALVLVAERGSFSAAAAELGLTQPAVSQQIKALEDELGCTLLDRHAVGPNLTQAGQEVYQRARTILRLWDDACSAVRNCQETLAGNLTIGASSVPATYLLPGLLAEFALRWPAVNVSLQVGDSIGVMDDLLSRRCDLAVVGSEPKDKRLTSTYFAEDEVVLIAPPSYLPQKGKLGPQDLLNYRFVMREPGSGTRHAAERQLEQCGIRLRDLNVVAEIATTEALIAAVSAGMGVAFVSEWAAKPAVRDNRVIELPITCAPIRRHFQLVYHTAKKNDRLLMAFVKHLERHRPRFGIFEPITASEEMA